MRRWGQWCVWVAVVPLVGCQEESVARQQLPPLVARAMAPDNRPDAGPREVGVDMTAIARLLNEPGKEPKLPTDKGKVRRARRKPKVKKTTTGFAARLPKATSVPTPAFHRGHVITGGFGAHEVHALDPKTGKAKWSVRLSDDGPTAPVCEGEVCVFNTYSCTIFSVAADTGKHKWSWWLGAPQLATPVIFDGVVYTSYPGDNPPPGAPYVIAAFDLDSGKPLWRRWIDAEVNSTPVVVDGKLFFATQVGSLYQLTADDGAILSVRHNRVASPPTVIGSGVFFARDDDTAENDLLATAHVMAPEFERAIPIMPTEVTPRPRPLVAAHRLVTVEDGVIAANHHETGESLWRHRLEDGAAEVSAPILYAGGSVLLATAGGQVVRMHEDTGDVMQRYDLGAKLASQPIVEGGWIYAGTTDGSVVGYDTGDAELGGWPMLGGGPTRTNVAPVEGT